jgi:hypothetical protein
MLCVFIAVVLIVPGLMLMRLGHVPQHPEQPEQVRLTTL